MKEKLLNSLGYVGGIIWFIVSSLIYVLPFVMIGASFWLNLLLFSIVYFFPASSVIFWIWGLVCAIQGPQDVWAIAYYILFAVLFLPFFVSIISSLVRTRKTAKAEQEMPHLDIGPDAKVNWRD